MTAKQIKALDKSLHTSGTSLTNRTWKFKGFQKRFSRYFPELATLDNTLMRDCLRIVGIQVDINKVLRKRGMAIKSSGYYNTFTVVENTSKKVEQLDNKVNKITHYRNELNEGIFNYRNSYSAKLDSTEIESIVNQASVQVARIKY